MARTRLLVLLALGCAIACVDDDAPAGRASAAAVEAEASLRCPPCGMRMAADTPLREIAGHSWAVCNERCAELIAEDPQLFLELAVPE